jgi:hypothetical protein
MPTAKSDVRLPIPDDHHEDVFYGSPMALVGLFVEVARARFRDDNAEALPWVWRENLLVPADADDAVDAPRRLYVESAYTSNKEVRNYRPAVFVEKGPTVPVKTVIGNRSGALLHKGIETFYTMAQVPIELACVSEERGESAQIADYVWFHLMACRLLIGEAYGVHNVGEPQIGKTAPYRLTEGNRDSWTTPVTFECVVEYRWKTTPIAPLLASVQQTLRLRGGGDSTTGAIVTAVSILDEK